MTERATELQLTEDEVIVLEIVAAADSDTVDRGTACERFLGPRNVDDDPDFVLEREVAFRIAWEGLVDKGLLKLLKSPETTTETLLALTDAGWEWIRDHLAGR